MGNEENTKDALVSPSNIMKKPSIKELYGGLINGNYNTFYNNYTINKNTYNIFITNTALCNRMEGESSREAYQRNMLESIARVTTKVSGVIGVIKSFRKSKKGKDIMYIGNLFWRDMYITNHVVAISYKNKSHGELKCGHVITFDAKIEAYNSVTIPSYLKYGLTDIVITGNLYTQFRSINLLPEQHRTMDKCFKSEDVTDRVLKYVISRIRYITLKTSMYPENFFINILLNIHFGENYEKLLLVHQTDYNYLAENVSSLLCPMCALLYLLEDRNMIDAYSILIFINQLYNKLKNVMVPMIIKETGITKSELMSTVSRNNLMLDKYSNFDDIMNDLKIYTNNIIVEVVDIYNELHK